MNITPKICRLDLKKILGKPRNILLIKSLFHIARYFKAKDSYNRLNTTNANLYRANERLEKINGKLTEENTRLRAENKDYSLLRKVFSHKQIDDLLEKARNIKGQKRDDTRSR